jgi:MFS superfamily sulfate permease-like transporter
MSWQKSAFLAHWRQDLPAAIVVFLLSLPLTLGIALASGVPMFSGIITAVVGGVVVSIISKSPLNISGPAASMAVIVASSIQGLPSFGAFYLAVVLAGVLQIALGLLRAGNIGDLLPASVINGMLAAIGITIIKSQLPRTVGYDRNLFLQEFTTQVSGAKAAITLPAWYTQFYAEAVVISLVALAILIGWNHPKLFKPAFFKPMPAPLIAILASVLVHLFFQLFFPKTALSDMHFVRVPDSAKDLFSNFSFPNFSFLTHAGVWSAAAAMAIIASIQTLLGVEGTDKLDPLQRSTPLNRELIAQGVGNIASGMLGGILLTSVIIRSMANVNAGARTQASAILQGVFLLVFVGLFPHWLNRISLAALATVLVYMGFQLVRPAVWVQSYRKGWAYLLPFLATIGIILWTDLLTGVCAGLMISVVFILRDTFHPLYLAVQEGNRLTIRFEKDLTFIQKYELNQLLKNIPTHATLILDFSNVDFIDEAISTLLTRFIQQAPQRCITLNIETGKNTAAGHLSDLVHKLP